VRVLIELSVPKGEDRLMPEMGALVRFLAKE
jgi:hypothetical protein